MSDMQFGPTLPTAILYTMSECPACQRAQEVLINASVQYRVVRVEKDDARVIRLAGRFFVPLLVTEDGDVQALAHDAHGSRFVPVRRKEVSMSTEPKQVSYVTEQHIKNALGHMGMQLLHVQAENESLRALIQTLEKENAALKERLAAPASVHHQ